MTLPTTLGFAAFAAALLASIASMASPISAHAEDMKIQPGSWQFTSTSTTPMSPTPRVSTETACITEDSMSPERFARDIDGCTVGGIETSATSMKWTMSCPGPQASMKGLGEVHSRGDRVDGKIVMEMSMPGMPSMTMTNTWKGTRVGDCAK